MNSQKLWYKNSAENWDEALPIGNGRIGGMVFGNAYREQIQVNEDSIWSGGPRNRNNPNAKENLEKVRELLFENKIKEAEELVNIAFCGVPVNQRHYQLLGDLFVAQKNLEQINNYQRDLDLTTAITTTKFTSNGVNYTREAFISSPDNVLVFHIKADKPSSVSLMINLEGRDDYFDDCRPDGDNNGLFMFGGMGSDDGIFFASSIKAKSSGGKVKTMGNYILVDDADEATIYLSCRTNFRHEEYKDLAVLDTEMALNKGYEQIKNDHIDDYQKLYNRCSLSLNDNSNGNSSLPTNERLERIRNGEPDNKLIEMYFNFGRYLTIAGSREGTLPTNLQGIWNKDMWPAWGGKYTININTEMNYWPTEICNLSECHLPLFDHIERMRPNGRYTAEYMYGCKGFTCHHNTDIWGDTAPQDLWVPATQWPMGAAWLCLHIYEHFKFTNDLEFLKEKYATLKEAAEFFVDFLIEDKKGRLVTAPSVSPENTYITEVGTQGCVCIGPSMDSQIINVLFSDIIEASEILGIDKEFADKLSTLRDKLPKPEIGKYGQIKEWAEDYDEAEPGHRHISQLFALYPADLISVRKTPQLAKSARATIERRLSYGGGHTGWSRAWIVNLWARLLDGEKVYENIIALLGRSTNPNMFDSHPPFQIDGNYGGTAGIAEALLQSHSNEITILPSCPSQFESGEVKGLIARGGFEISFSFSGGKVIDAKIVSQSGNTCRFHSDTPITVSSADGIIPTILENDVYSFDTVKGEVYNIIY